MEAVDAQNPGKRRRATLTKNPPPSALASRGPSLRKPQSSTSLQRVPSAPYPRSQIASHSARDIHQRTGSNAYGSSTSSLERPSASDSPIVAPHDHFHSANAFQLRTPSRSSSDNRPNDLIGAPFDASGILSSIQSTANGPTSAPISKPQLHPLVPPATSPNLGNTQQLSTQPIPPGGQPMMEVTPPRSENGTLSPKRTSVDGPITKPTALRKKSGFSSFVNSMLGSPRTIKISAPENPMHMIHVGYDNVTGQFTVGGHAGSRISQYLMPL
jgi:p21-activated kinase 1